MAKKKDILLAREVGMADPERVRALIIEIGSLAKEGASDVQVPSDLLLALQEERHNDADERRDRALEGATDEHRNLARRAWLQFENIREADAEECVRLSKEHGLEEAVEMVFPHRGRGQRWGLQRAFDHEKYRKGHDPGRYVRDFLWRVRVRAREGLKEVTATQLYLSREAGEDRVEGYFHLIFG